MRARRCGWRHDPPGSARDLPGAARCGWRCELPDGALHVWTADLDALGERHADVLCAREIERARRIVRPQARMRWVAARSFVRMLLGAYVGGDVRSLRLLAQPDGKPALAPEQADGLRFNVSHSEHLAVCALTRACAVGVDVQLAPRRGRLEAVAERAFGHEQARRLLALPAAQRERELLQAWARLEAEHKRTGLGIARPHERASGPRPWCALLELAVAGAAAVTLARPPTAVAVTTFTDTIPIIGPSVLGQA